MSRVIKSYFANLDMQNAVAIDIPDNELFAQDFQPELQEDELQEILAEHKLAPEEQATLILENANRQAKEILDNAELQAERILEDVQKQGELQCKIKEEESRQEGYDTGYRQGMEQAESLKQEASSLLEQTKKECEAMVQDLEPSLVNLVAEICEKLLGNSGKLNPDVILYLIRQGLSQSTIAGNLYIRVSPDDYDHTLQNIDNILMLVDGKSKLEVLKDSALNKNDCVIETPLGNIDVSLDLQFQALKEELFHILKTR